MRVHGLINTDTFSPLSSLKTARFCLQCNRCDKMASPLQVSMLVCLVLCASSLVEAGFTPPRQPPPGQLHQHFMNTLGRCARNLTGVKEPDVMCARVPEVNKCLQEAESRWNETHTEVERKVFIIYKDLWIGTSERLCQGEGQELADLLQAYEMYRLIPSVDKDVFWTECLFYGSMITKITEESEADLPTKVWFKYNQIQYFDQCFEKYMGGHANFLRDLHKLTSSTLDVMKCLRPGDEEIAPCKDIDTGLIDRDSVCLTRDEFTFPAAGEFMAKKTVACLKDTPYGPSLSEAESLEQIQRYFQKYCTVYEKKFLHCQCETSVAGDLCLSEGDYVKLKLVRSYAELVRDTGCIAGGRGLATMVYRYNVAHNSTGEGETGITDCLRGTLVDESGSLDVNGYYNELSTIKQCLMDKMLDDSVFELELNSLYETIRNKMKCLNPDNGQVALCKDIV